MLLIPKIGIMGASVATVISWFIIVLLKIIYLNKFIKLKVQFYPYIISTILIIFEILILLFLNNTILIYLLNVIITIVVILLNNKIIKKIFVFLKNKLLKK